MAAGATVRTERNIRALCFEFIQAASAGNDTNGCIERVSQCFKFSFGLEWLGILALAQSQTHRDNAEAAELKWVLTKDVAQLIDTIIRYPKQKAGLDWLLKSRINNNGHHYFHIDHRSSY